MPSFSPILYSIAVPFAFNKLIHSRFGLTAQVLWSFPSRSIHKPTVSYSDGNSRKRNRNQPKHRPRRRREVQRTKRQKRRDEIRKLKARVAELEGQQTDKGQDKDTSKDNDGKGNGQVDE